MNFQELNARVLNEMWQNPCTSNFQNPAD